MAFRLSFAEEHSYASAGNAISVPVRLRAGVAAIDLEATLDTGAAFCRFERKYAEGLGLVVENGEPMTFATANSSFKAFGHDLTISTLGVEVESHVFFFADEEIVKNVLGRRGWLDRFRIGIVDHDQLLYLARYAD